MGTPQDGLTLELVEADLPEREGLSDDQKARLDQVYESFSMYARGATSKAIAKRTGVSRQRLSKLIKRFLTQAPGGTPYGWTAIVGRTHLRVGDDRSSSPENLNSGKAKSGCLRALFTKYPAIHESMRLAVLKSKPPGEKRPTKRMTPGGLHEDFLELCRKEGLVEPYDYPFCSKSQGYAALQRWARWLREREASGKSARPEFEYPKLQTHGCYSRVECDGHKLDITLNLRIPAMRGKGWIDITVTRIWLVLIIEVVSGAVLGYSISLGENYCAADVLRAFHAALVPWKPRQLSISTIRYPEGGGLPSGVDEALAFVRVGEVHFDNALAHMANVVVHSLQRMHGGAIVWGRAGQPNDRPTVEMFFNIIEEALIHQLDGTTGSSTDDPRRDRGRDKRRFIWYDHLLDALDILLARWNVAFVPGTSIRRLDMLKMEARDNPIHLRRVPRRFRALVAAYDIYDIQALGQEHGRKVLRWKGARYHGNILKSPALRIGEPVLIRASSRDLRVIEIASLKNGAVHGELFVEKRWSHTPHGLEMRNAYARQKPTKGIVASSDIPKAIRQQAEKNALDSSKAARALARAASEQESTDLAEADDELANAGPQVNSQRTGNQDVPREPVCDPALRELIDKLGPHYR